MTILTLLTIFASASSCMTGEPDCLGILHCSSDRSATHRGGAEYGNSNYGGREPSDMQLSWADITWAMAGDSIVAQNKWEPLVASSLGVKKFINWGVSGSRMNEVLNLRRPKDFLKIDVLGISSGTNDFAQQTPLGSDKDPIDAPTFWSAMRNIVVEARKNNCRLKMFLMTPLHRKDEGTLHPKGTPLRAYVDAMIKFGKKYSIPVYDQYRLSGINDSNTSTYLFDDLHPNDRGGVLIGRNVLDFMGKLLMQKGEVAWCSGGTSKKGRPYREPMRSHYGTLIAPDFTAQFDTTSKAPKAS